MASHRDSAPCVWTEVPPVRPSGARPSPRGRVGCPGGPPPPHPARSARPRGRAPRRRCRRRPPRPHRVRLDNLESVPVSSLRPRTRCLETWRQVCARIVVLSRGVTWSPTESTLYASPLGETRWHAFPTPPLRVGSVPRGETLTPWGTDHVCNATNGRPAPPGSALDMLPRARQSSRSNLFRPSPESQRPRGPTERRSLKVQGIFCDQIRITPDVSDGQSAAAAGASDDEPTQRTCGCSWCGGLGRPHCERMPGPIRWHRRPTISAPATRDVPAQLLSVYKRVDTEYDIPRASTESCRAVSRDCPEVRGPGPSVFDRGAKR